MRQAGLSRDYNCDYALENILATDDLTDDISVPLSKTNNNIGLVRAASDDSRMVAPATDLDL